MESKHQQIILTSQVQNLKDLPRFSLRRHSRSLNLGCFLSFVKALDGISLLSLTLALRLLRVYAGAASSCSRP